MLHYEKPVLNAVHVCVVRVQISWSELGIVIPSAITGVTLCVIRTKGGTGNQMATHETQALP